MRRRLLVAAVALLAGCGTTVYTDLASEFEAMRDDGLIDQAVALENRGEKAIAPRLEFTPLDADGKEIEGLKVRTAHGSDRGRRVLPVGTVVLELLSFEGARKRDVEDVDVYVHSPDEVDLPAKVDDPEAIRIGKDGKQVGYGVPFETFRIVNRNDVEVSVRVVFIEYEDPIEGEAQQFTRVTPLLDGLVRVPAGGRTDHPLPADLRGRAGTVIAYLSR